MTEKNKNNTTTTSTANLETVRRITYSSTPAYVTTPDGLLVRYADFIQNPQAYRGN